VSGPTPAARAAVMCEGPDGRAITTVTRKIFRTFQGDNHWTDAIHLTSRNPKVTVNASVIAVLHGVVVDDDTFSAHLTVGGIGALFRDGAMYAVVESDSPLRDVWRIMRNEDTTCVIVQDIEIIWREGDGNYPPVC
jgi:hypothetical protein